MFNYILVILFSIPFTVIAQQNNWNQEGDLEDSQVIIEKNRKIDLPKINRDFKKVPEIKANRIPFTLDFNSKQFIPNLTSLSPRIRVLTIQDEKLDKLYANQVKLGVGNYGASYFEGAFASKRSTNKSYGLNLFHQSFANGPIDGRNSGSGYQKVNPYGKLILNRTVFDTELFYERQNNHLYGYNPASEDDVDRDSIQRAYHTVGAKASLHGENELSPYQYTIGIESYQLFSNVNNREFSLDYAIENSFQLKDELALYLNTDGYLSSLKFSSTKEAQFRNLIRFKPGVKFIKGNLRLRLGLNLVYENDTLDKMNKFHVFPHLSVNFALFDQYTVFGGIKGNVKANRYRDFLVENPYLDDIIRLYNTLMPFQFYGGIRGSYQRFLTFQGGFSIAAVRYNFGYEAFYEDNEAEIRYRPKYFNDQNTEANIHALLNTNTKTINFGLRADYFYYNLGENERMPFRPNYSLKMSTDYAIAKKLKIGLNVYLQGRMNTSNTIISENVNYALNLDEAIKPIYDLGIKLEYKLSGRSRLFLNANNLIDNKYEYYLGYPNRGFQIMGGFTYSF